MNRLCVLSFVCLLGIGCAKDNNLTGPSNTSIPNVAGNYSGTTTVSLPERGIVVTCTTTTAVTQASGGRVNIAPLVMRPGAPTCAGLSMPVGEGTIDATGAL